MASYLQTTNDLRIDALFRAGEPQSSSSQFWTKSLVYLNRVQRDLVIGGGISVGQPLSRASGFYAWVGNDAVTDFFWARRLGRFNTTAGQSNLTVTATQGSTAITLSAAPTVNISDWRIQIAKLRTLPRIAGGAGTAWVLDGEWPEDTQTTAACDIFKPDYDLPADFVRFSAPVYGHGSFARTIPVSTRETQFEEWPWANVVQGQPYKAFRIGDQKIALNSWDTKAYRFEFDYIAIPADLQEDSIPIIPMAHRSLLSTGAAMMILVDKNDERAQNLASEYREQVHRMVQAHNRSLTGGSSDFGVFKTREPVQMQRSLQPQGELYLV